MPQDRRSHRGCALWNVKYYGDVNQLACFVDLPSASGWSHLHLVTPGLRSLMTLSAVIYSTGIRSRQASSLMRAVTADETRQHTEVGS